MSKIGVVEKIYNFMETLIMKLVPQKRVGPLFKWLFKLPILHYKLGLGWMIGKYVLLLTTTGRKAERPAILRSNMNMTKRTTIIALQRGGEETPTGIKI